MLDLDADYLARIQKILGEQVPNKRVWAYGSRVKGSAHEGSDLDLVILDEISPESLSSLQTAFSESNLPILVSILSWEDLPESFRTEIQQGYEVLQGGLLS